MNQKDITKLKRLADIADKGLEGVVSELNDLDEKLDETTATLTQKIDEAINIATETQKMEGKSGYTPVKGKDYFDGQDYVLTEEDKRHIADITLKDIKIPIVEKVIEKVEVIKEPTVKEIVKEIVKEPQIIKETIKEVPQDVLDKMSSLDLSVKEIDRIVKNNLFDPTLGVSKTELSRIDTRLKAVETNSSSGTLTNVDGVVDIVGTVDKVIKRHTPNATLNYTSGDLSSITLSDGRTINLTYDGSGNLTQVADGFYTWTLAYDGSSNLSTITVT